DLQSGKAEQHARGIRIADSRSGYLDIAAGPAPGSRVPLRTATNFVILARELEMNGAVERCVFQPWRGMPWEREHERRVADEYESMTMNGLDCLGWNFAGFDSRKTWRKFQSPFSCWRMYTTGCSAWRSCSNTRRSSRSRRS